MTTARNDAMAQLAAYADTDVRLGELTTPSKDLMASAVEEHQKVMENINADVEREKRQNKEDARAKQQAIRQAERDAKAAQKELDKRDKTAQKQRKEDEENEEKQERVALVERQRILAQAATVSDRAFNLGKGVVQNTSTRLEALPDPGGLLLPLGILLLFFFILLPVNGHTRLMWLWLAITGNAEIGPPLIPPTQIIAPFITAPGTAPGLAQEAVNPNTPSTSVNQTPTNQPGPIAVKPKPNKVPTKSVPTSTPTPKSHVGSGPGPHNPGIEDPQHPHIILSYSHLIGGKTGYE